MEVQYVNDSLGNIKAVQLPFPEWKKIMLKLRKYEQMFRIKSDLTEAFAQVEVLKKSKMNKQSLKDFLDEL